MSNMTRRELDPSIEAEETKFHEQVRDILGLSPFDRHEQIYAELRRLKAKRFIYVVCEMIGGDVAHRHAVVNAKSVEEAYDVGHSTVRQPDGNGINDYVIEI